MFVTGLLQRLRERAREMRKPVVARSRDELTARERSMVGFHCPRPIEIAREEG